MVALSQRPESHTFWPADSMFKGETGMHQIFCPRDEQLPQRFLQHLAILYVDLVGSTAYGEKYGPFALFNRIKRLEELVTPIVERCRGEKVKLVGDAVIARFNEADDAVAAGIAIQQELLCFNAPLDAQDQIHVKVAINYGEAVVIGNDVYGDSINTAERVLRETSANEVRISESVLAELDLACAALFVNQGDFTLKGKAQMVRLFCHRTAGL